MSSVSHCRVQTIEKASLIKAAKDLKMNVSEKEGTVFIGSTKFAFGKDDVATVSYYDDIKSCTKTTKQLTQLSSFYTMKKRLETRGLKLETSTKDAVAAVNANQSLELVFVQA
jgi:hypothetical protein